LRVAAGRALLADIRSMHLPKRAESRRFKSAMPGHIGELRPIRSSRALSDQAELSSGQSSLFKARLKGAE